MPGSHVSRQEWLLVLLAAIFLFGLFSAPVSDSDFWWHLKTGQYIAEHHALPSPDPFAWTTSHVTPAYPGEERTRAFNLTHEWLAQVAVWLAFRVGGFPAVVAMRALCMVLVCGVVGLICARRDCFYMGLAGALACGSVLVTFALDRPYQVTFLFLGLIVTAMEFRRYLWALPVLFAVWANCHGGYFLGFVVLGAYIAESLWLRRVDRTLWLVTLASVAASALNPNGFGVFRTLLDYRASYMQSRLLEWSRPAFWPPSAFSMLLVIALALMVWQRRRVRLADWLLFLAFTAAAWSALRNTAFVGIVAPVWIAGAWPWRRPLPGIVKMLAPAAGVAAIVALPVLGNAFQFRAETWKFPSGAADFLKANGIRGPLFNTYEHGGYLIWRLAPELPVFIDGRALSDNLFLDYARILYNHEDNDGKPSGEQLLDRYGIQTILMNTFELSSGAVYVLAPALADPAQKTWKLVYGDAQAVVFVRTPPSGVAARNSLEVFQYMEAGCTVQLENEPKYPRCARSLGEVFLKIGDRDRARRWLAAYLEKATQPDPEAQAALQQLLR